MKNFGCVSKKISSKRGAAMLIALLVFFLAALSGTVALTMAASNAGRYTHEKDDQQAYLSVASAAKLILNKLESFSVEYKSTTQSPPNEEQIEITYYGPDYKFGDPGDATQPTAAGLLFSDERFQNMLKTFSLGTLQESAPFSFVLTVTEAAEMGRVYVKLRLDGTDFSFRFYSMRGESRYYRMTLKVTGTFDKFGVGNFQVGKDNLYYRVLDFTDPTFTVEKELVQESAE